MPDFLQTLAMAGTIAFAISGALQAVGRRMDLVGFIFIACITGVGGGTVRDLLLDVPVFWLGEWHYVAACTVAAVVTFFASGWLSRGSKALLWADAAGMAVFSVLGMQMALEVGVAIPVSAALGMFSACLGGIIRDVILNEVPIILRREIYVTASLAGALAYGVAAQMTPLPEYAALAIGCGTAFGIRALAITRNLSLPAHREQP